MSDPVGFTTAPTEFEGKVIVHMMTAPDYYCPIGFTFKLGGVEYTVQQVEKANDVMNSVFASCGTVGLYLYESHCSIVICGTDDIAKYDFSSEPCDECDDGANAGYAMAT